MSSSRKFHIILERSIERPYISCFSLQFQPQINIVPTEVYHQNQAAPVIPNQQGDNLPRMFAPFNNDDWKKIENPNALIIPRVSTL